MPPKGTCYLVCLDNVTGAALCVIVNGSTPNYFNLQVALVDGHDTDKGHVALQMGNQFGFVNGKPDTSTPPLGTQPARPDGSDPSDNPSTQWTLEGDVFVNTPAWPDLKKFIVKWEPAQVNA